MECYKWSEVINVSIGVEEGVKGTNNSYGNAMNKLIKRGYDFVIVHSAGNGSINASEDSVNYFV